LSPPPSTLISPRHPKSQPSISRQLKNLEEEFKVALYRRVSSGIELTEEGKRFLTSAELLLMQLAMMNRRSSVTSKTETLIVGGSHAPSAVLLPSVLAIFQKSHPQVQLMLRTHNSTPMEQLVLKREVEIALIIASSFDPHLVVEPFRKERIRIFACTNHRLAKRKELTPAELASAPLIVRQGKGGKGGFQKILQQMDTEGLKPNIVMRCESAEGVKTQVKMGLGLGILYQDQIESDLKAGKFKIIKVPKLKFDAESYIVYRKDRPLSTLARDLLSLLRRYRQKHRRINGTRRAA
jgi:DNA-binding transcriptional LysR family regulator